MPQRRGNEAASFESLARIGAGVQVYSKRRPEFSSSIPHFYLLGEESSGKTTLLNGALALRFIGGAIQSATGTRCPVNYYLSSGKVESFFVGKDLDHMDSVPLSGIWEYVTKHMAALAQSEEKFSSIPLHIQVCTPDTLDAVIIDLPGQKPHTSQDGATRISEMIEAHLSTPKAIPIILATVDRGGARDSMDRQVKRVIEACQSEASRAAMGRALVFVSSIDCLKDNGAHGIQHFVDLRTVLRGISGTNLLTNESNLVLLSLKPHLLSGNAAAVAVKLSTEGELSTFNFPAANDYYKGILATERRS